MAKKYNPHKIEAKWREIWPKERQSYKLESGEQPYYTLDMFPYPSSDGLHMGHWRPYTIADVWARYQTLRGKKVLRPVGFDAFGLPAENAAIKTKTPPQAYTQKSISNFTRQLQEMGNMYDWSTCSITSDPEYYKWTQWIFLQLYKHGLAYRKSAPVNWCLSCQTVLANEQVVQGRCERCGTDVIKKQLRQWFFKITDFAEDLLDFSDVTYPERVKTLQTNWIGKSEGVAIVFPIQGDDLSLAVFTTRPDTLMGVTYLVIAPEHQLLEHLVTPEQQQYVSEYLVEAQQKSEIDRLAEDRKKTGVFTGSYALHPLTQERVPIWVADYVIGSYGTGAVMGVPAHDTRDFVFATDYELPIVFVVQPKNATLDTTRAYVEPGVVTNSGEFDGLDSEAAKLAIAVALQERSLGSKTIQYRLRDWLVSRQRYWGAPIPIIYCEQCGEQAVPEKELPVLLPEDVDFLPAGGSPLERSESFKHTACPRCGKSALRETDTLDTFVDSSWYYLRYTSPHDAAQAFDTDRVKQWLPVDFYVGGVEHSTLHLLYARFVMKALCKLDLVPYDEPFKVFYGNGLIYLNGSKMSKSKGNVINPDEIVQQYGTDAMRGYILFMGPADQDVEWQTSGINGIRRFLERAWHCFMSVNDDSDTTVRPYIQQVYQSLSELLPAVQLNRCISALMVSINEAEKQRLNHHEAEILITLFAPFFPHFAEEVWESLGHTSSIFDARWPELNVQESTHTTYVIQVSGRVKATLELDKTLDESAVINQSKSLPAVDTALAGKTIVKTVFVPGRIVNFVVE